MTSSWTKVKINKQYLGMRDGTKVLVFFPFDGPFAEWSAWVPSKLLREIDDDWFTVSTRPDFTFTIQTFSRDETGKWVETDKSSMNGQTFIEIFSALLQSND